MLPYNLISFFSLLILLLISERTAKVIGMALRDLEYIEDEVLL